MKTMIQGALLAIAAPAAVLVAPAAMAASAHSPQTMALVVMMSPQNVMAQIAGRSFDTLLAQDKSGGQFAAEFAAHPGMKEFVAARVKDRMVAILDSEIGTLRDQMAELIEREMTPQEIVDVKTFFESPTGTRIRKLTYEALVASPPLPGHEGEAQQAAVAKFMATMTADDYPPLTAFGASSGSAKMKALNPRIAEISQRWGTSTMQAHAGEMKVVVDAARKEFLARPKAPGA